jgi:hypothetical protein
LSNIELLFNTTTHSRTGFSPYEIIFGRNPPNPLSRLIEPLLPAVDPKPLEQIREEVRANLRRAGEQRRNSRRDAFKVGDLVLLRENPVSDAAGRVFAKFCLFYSGPYLISERPYPNVYTLMILPQIV